MTTKILPLIDALGNLADICLLPGQAHDLRGVPDLIKGLNAGHMMADRAFNADWLRKTLLEHDIAPVIPPRKNRESPPPTTKKCTNGGIWSRTSFRRSRITEA
nr:hypothetical protein [uncultured Roseovarius sp.]